ncbi:MAG: hypothetical protein FJZ96_15980 [Chloroflexi bacterium]|nr:hypothetical protein [Chloroflexota bacterium]
MPELLNEQTREEIRQVFKNLKEPVRILFFGTQEQCDYCSETRQLVEEVSALSDKLNLTVHDIQVDDLLAHKFNVDRVPSLVVASLDGQQVSDHGIRFSGIPSGQEFSAFINALALVSGRDSGLSQQTRAFLKNIDTPILLQVFATPT